MKQITTSWEFAFWKFEAWKQTCHQLRGNLTGQKDGSKEKQLNVKQTKSRTANFAIVICRVYDVGESQNARNTAADSDQFWTSVSYHTKTNVQLNQIIFVHMLWNRKVTSDDLKLLLRKGGQGARHGFLSLTMSICEGQRWNSQGLFSGTILHYNDLLTLHYQGPAPLPWPRNAYWPL
jgi:hypothetical protein